MKAIPSPKHLLLIKSLINPILLLSAPAKFKTKSKAERAKASSAIILSPTSSAPTPNRNGNEFRFARNDKIRNAISTNKGSPCCKGSCHEVTEGIKEKLQSPNHFFSLFLTSLFTRRFAIYRKASFTASPALSTAPPTPSATSSTP